MEFKLELASKIEDSGNERGLVAFVGIVGGLRALPSLRHIEHFSRILSKHFLDTRLVPGVSYCICYHIGGEIVDFKDREFNCRYYTKKMSMFSTFSISLSTLMSMNDETMHRWFCRILELNLIALRERSKKLQPDIDTLCFELATVKTIKEVSELSIPEESETERMFRVDYLPTIEAICNEQFSKRNR